MIGFFKSLPPKFTLFITAVCVICYFFSHNLGGRNDEFMLLMNFPADDWQQTEYWRYVSHSLVHLSLPHIGFNLAWWWLFGGAIEKTFGTFRLMLLYVIAAVVTGILQNWASGPWFFGLSGVVYAVLGFVFIVDKLSVQPPFDLPEGFLTMLLVGIGLGFVSPLIGIEIGNTAHISGLIIGLLFGGIQVGLEKIKGNQ